MITQDNIDQQRQDEINRLYKETLGRNVDPEGLANYLRSELSSEDIKKSLAKSEEGQNLIKQTYQDILGREVDPSGLQTYTNLLGREQAYIDPYKGSEVDYLKSSLQTSPEYLKNHPLEGTAGELAKAYEQYLGRPIDASGLAFWTQKLKDANGDMSVIQNAVKTSDEANLRQQLGRQPTEEESHNYMAAMDAQRHSSGFGFGDIFKIAIPLAIAYFAPELAPELFSSEGAVAAETGLSTLPSSVLPASEAFATGSELAAGADLAGTGAAAASGYGLNPSLPTSEFGTFDPSKVSGYGYSGATPGVVGSNASSGMSYLGGAESLPSGTAGIKGVTEGGLSLSNAKKMADVLKSISASNRSGYSSSNVGQGYSMPNPFFTPKEVQTMADLKATQPIYLGQLANLLRG